MKCIFCKKTSLQLERNSCYYCFLIYQLNHSKHGLTCKSLSKKYLAVACYKLFLKNCMFLLAINLLEIRPAVAISKYIGVDDKGIYIGIDKSYYKPEAHLFFLKILKIYLVNCIVTCCIA